MKETFSIVLVIIGALIGAGFASGQEIYSFFYSYGAIGLIGIIVTCSLMSVLIYKILKIICINEIKSYDEFLSLFIKSIIVQTAIFVILSACLILLTRKFVNRIGKNDNTITNVNSIIGKEALVIKEINPLSGSHGQVKVNGDLWSAICSSDETIEVGSKVKILKIDGVKLIVEPIKFCQKETV